MKGREKTQGNGEDCMRCKESAVNVIKARACKDAGASVFPGDAGAVKRERNK